jgi:hypothetical protein
MSEVDDKYIRDRLKRLSHIEPTQEASDRAVQRVRDTLKSDEAIPKLRLSLRDAFRWRLPPFVAKLAAAAVFLIGAAFLAGRLSAPKPLDVEALQATLESSLRSSLEPAIRQELFDEMENRLQLTLAADRAALKQELHQQVGRDLKAFVDHTLTAVGNLTDQRFMEFARMVEAARIKERQRVAAAFDYMGSRFGDGLVTLASHANELQRPEQN